MRQFPQYEGQLSRIAYFVSYSELYFASAVKKSVKNQSIRALEQPLCEIPVAAGTIVVRSLFRAKKGCFMRFTMVKKIFVTLAALSVLMTRA